MRNRLLIAALVLVVAVQGEAANRKPTRDEAAKRLQSEERPLTGEGLLGILSTSSDNVVDLLEAYLAIGIPANKPISFKSDSGDSYSAYPLNYMLRYACHDPKTAEMARLLIEAGADASLRDAGDNDRTPAIASVGCPDVLRVILAQKPDLTITDKFKRNVLSHAIHNGEPAAEVVKMLLEAGFDPKPSMKELREDARGRPEILALLAGKKAPVAATAIAKPVMDWKALPPYPTRSADQARKSLSRPGAATTIQDHFWDGITQREPLRLALAIAAGANVRDTRSVTGYSPIVLMAERCDLRSDAEQQVAVAELLIAAGADLAGVDANRANALTMAAHDCPVGVIRALIKAGLPLSAVSSIGDTPLRVAILADRVDVVAALLEGGLDPKKEPYNARKLASDNSEIEALLKKKR